ncbi:MAG: T9SS type A sorting domain-containing protein [Bacteroidetes bacterium]|jgi:hypothetical protein|nr:T9SS type A sorting domain-containing protein [Bacteroidota bacterium]
MLCLLAVLLTAAPASAQEIEQIAKLTASDGEAGDFFGANTALEGNHAFVSASYHDEQRGAVYVFERQENDTWTETAKLEASDGATEDRFGSAIAVAGGRLYVGAPFHDLPGVSFSDHGAVYVFERDEAGTWTETAKLTTDGASVFGSAVAAQGEFLLAGNDDNETCGVNVFKRAGDQWEEQEPLQPFSQQDQRPCTANFGLEDIAFDGRFAFVGADAMDEQGDNSGTVFVYELLEYDVWAEHSVLVPDTIEEGARFGWRVALDGNQALAGPLNSGEVHLFALTNGVWEAERSFPATTFDVALDGPFAMIGSDLYLQQEDGTWSDGMRVEGCQIHNGRMLTDDRLLCGNTSDDEQAENAGAAFLYRLPDATSTDVERETGLPDAVALDANYPNPFNPQTTVRYALPEAADVRLAVYDLLGREVAVLVNGVLPAGTHTTVFDAAGLPSGVYLYRLEAGAHVQTRRMTLLK